MDRGLCRNWVNGHCVNELVKTGPMLTSDIAAVLGVCEATVINITVDAFARIRRLAMAGNDDAITLLQMWRELDL